MIGGFEKTSNETVMADDITRPPPKFYCSVQLGDDKRVTFQEVTGLQAETKAIAYRHGNSPIFSPIKNAGALQRRECDDEKGVFAKDTRLFAWCLDVKKEESSKRRVVEIRLLDEDGRRR